MNDSPNHPPLSNQQIEAQAKARKLLSYFAWSLMLIGLPFLLFGVYFIVYGHETSSWDKVEGTVVAIQTEVDVDLSTPYSSGQTRMSRDNKYFFKVEYNYPVNDQIYTSTRYSMGEGSRASDLFEDRTEAMAKGKKKYPIGSPITVYCNPDSPTDAVISAGINLGTVSPLLIGLFIFGCGLLFKIILKKAT